MLAVAPLRFAAVKSFCLSAAEKRDYEASFLSRQLLFAEFFRFAWLQLPRLASQSRPSQSTCFTTFTASSSSSCFASCAALLNGSRTIASLSKPWQGFLEKYFIDHFGNDETAPQIKPKKTWAACAAHVLHRIGEECDQRFLNCGGRFSRKAAMPSFWSSVPKVAWNMRRSYWMPSASVVS